MLNRLKTFCPNCLSAWTGGDAYPEKRTWCVVCSHPKTGALRGWVWRWPWFQRKLVTNKNYRKYKSLEAKGETP